MGGAPSAAGLAPKADAEDARGGSGLCPYKCPRETNAHQHLGERLKDVSQQLREKQKSKKVRLAHENVGTSGQPRGGGGRAAQDAGEALG